MSLGLFVLLAYFIPAILSFTGVSLCREIIIFDLRQRLHQGLGIEYPRLSWNHGKLIELHRQHFPESRIPVVIRFLTFLGFGLMIGLVLIGFVAAFINHPVL